MMIAAAAAGAAVPWATILPIVGIALTPLIAWLTVKRRNSGRIATSDASTLWAEADRMRLSYKADAEASRSETIQLRGEVVNLRNEAERLRNAIGTWRDESEGLRTEVVALRAEVVKWREEATSWREAADVQKQRAETAEAKKANP
jgi:chromosome segregation ATPase